MTDRVPQPTTSIALSAPVPGTTNVQQPAAHAVKVAFAAARTADLDPTIRSAWRSAAWLEAHAAAYGLCRTYEDEWWHFEHLATSDCPPRLPSAADAG